MQTEIFTPYSENGTGAWKPQVITGTHCVCVMKINSFIGLLFRETAAVYSEDHAIYINSLPGKTLKQPLIQETAVF
jgi:hypothetical protein